MPAAERTGFSVRCNSLNTQAYLDAPLTPMRYLRSGDCHTPLSSGVRNDTLMQMLFMSFIGCLSSEDRHRWRSEARKLAHVLCLIGCLALLAATAYAQTGEVAVWVSSEDGKCALSPGDPLPIKKAKRTKKSDTIVVEPAKVCQSILGMGGSLEHATCYNLSRLPADERGEVIERLVSPDKGIGMNLMRICIGTSDFVGEPYYSYDDVPKGETDPNLDRFSIEKDQAYILPVLKTALEKNPGLLFFASPWSPPAWMKTNESLRQGELKRECYDAYARYFVKYIQAYQAEGIPIYAVTIQNEPRMSDPDYTTCLWTGAQQRDFIRDHLGPQFAKNNIKAKIWCWDHNWNYVQFPRTILIDPEAAKFVEGTGFHHYEGRVEAQGKFHEEFPDKPIFFTEGSVFRSKGAVRMIEILRNWSSSYNSWVLMLDEHRKPNNGPHGASATCVELKDNLSVKYNFDYYMYGQFMKFVPRAAERVASTAGDRSFANVAFRTPGGELVLVVVNTTGNERRFHVVFENKAFDAALGPQSVATYRWTPN